MTVSQPVTQRRLVNRLITHLREPLFWNGYALIFSSTATSALGLLYWGVAARQYNASVVGINTAAMSAMQLISLLSQLGMVNVANRFVPTAGKATSRLVLAGYGLALAMAFITSVIFVYGVAWWAPSLRFIRDDVTLSAWFIGSTMGWVIFVIQDAVLVGLRQATWVPIENVIYAISKIALLFVFAALLPQYGVFASWVIPSILIVIPTNLLIFGFLIPRHVRRSAGNNIRLNIGEIARFIAGNYTSTLIWNATVSILPLIVIASVGAEVSAYFYLPWTVAFALDLVSVNMNMSFLTEVATDAARLATYSLKTWLQTMRLLLPAVVIVEVAAPYILQVFGGNYAVEGSTLLRLLALSTLGYSFTAHFLEISRARQRNRDAVVAQAVLCGIILVLGVMMLNIWGITGFGVAWFVAQTSIGLYLAATQLSGMWLPQIDLPTGSRLSPLLHLFIWHFRNHQTLSEVNRFVPLLLMSVKDDSGHTLGEIWKARKILRTTTDMIVVALSATGAAPAALLKMPRSESSWQHYQEHQRVLAILRAKPDLQDFRNLLPTLLASGDYEQRHYAIEAYIAGVDALDLANQPASLNALVSNAAETIDILHAGTAVTKTIDTELLSNWVDNRTSLLETVYRTRTTGHTCVEAVCKLRMLLHDQLLGRSVALSWIHGDYWLGNLRVSQDGLRINGILDWELAAEDELPILDTLLLLITTLMAGSGLEMGDVIRQLLQGDSWQGHETTILRQAMQDYPVGDIHMRTLILLTWLRHVSDELSKSTRLGRHALWLAKNVETVLRQV